MKFIHGLLFLLILPLSGSGADRYGKDRGEVKVRSEKRYYFTGEDIRGVIEKGIDEPIFLPGCNPFSLEFFKEEGFVPVKEKRCPNEKKAIKVTTDIFTPDFNLQVEEEGYYRIVLTYGVGCKEGRSLSTSMCRDFKTIRSPHFQLRRRVESKD